MAGTCRSSSVSRCVKGAALALAVGAALLAGDAFARDGLRPVSELSNEQLRRNFDTIVFHNEFDGRVDERLRKWITPVRIFLDVRAGDPAMLHRLVDTHARHLAQITGFDIAIVTKREDANLTIVFERDGRLDTVGTDYFSTEFDIRTVMRTNLCFGRYHSNAAYEIFKAVIVIPTDRAMSRGKLAACIIEESTQVLGLPNDSDDVYPSIFNDRSIDDELTEQDMLLLRLLYDPRLTPGMPRADALQEVGRILEEIRR